MEIIFRKASIKDLQKIIILKEHIQNFHHYHKPEFYKKTDLPFTKNEFEEMLAGNASNIYIVESGDILYGYAITRVISFQGNPMIVDNKRLFIDDIIIDPEYRKRGIGKLLMDKLESICRSEGYNYLDLNVWSFNTDAIDFFRKHGMRVSMLRMEKEIDK